MAEKSKTDPAVPGETTKPVMQRPPGRAREAGGSTYDSFWHCLSGQHPAGRWTRDRDVAPLRSLRAAFGLAEEKQPIDYGPADRAHRTVPPTQGPSGRSQDARPRPAGAEDHRGVTDRPRRG